MRLKDYFSYTLTYLRRNKNKKSYCFVIFLCCIISFVVVTFNVNFGNLIEHNLSNVIGFRTYNVSPRISDDIIVEEQFEKDIKDLLTINHVSDVYDSAYNEFVISKSSFKTNKLDGTITLFRGTHLTLPNIVSGRTFKESETNVAVCPTQFYPTSNFNSINKKELINGEDIINTEFTIYYKDYIANMNTGELQENKTYSKTLKIVGLYDVSERFNNNNTCYISTQDIEEIIDADKSWTEQYKGAINYKGVSLNVVVDSVKNLDYVEKEIINMGFDIVGYTANFDSQLINIIKIVIIAVIFITLITIIYIVKSYSKKILISEEMNIATLRTLGYERKVVRNLYLFYILISHLIIYLIGSILFVLLFVILTNNVPFFVGLKLMMGNIKITIQPFIFTFLSTIIIPTFVIMYNIVKKFKVSIAVLFESDENRK